MPLRIRRLGAARASLALIACALAAAGCDEGRSTLPKVGVRVVDAAASRGTISFLREQQTEATLEYRGGSGDLVFDEDTYDFNVEVTPPGTSTPSLIGTFSQEVVSGTDYFFVLSESGGKIEPIVVATPTFASATDTQITVVHAAAAVAPLDAYVVAEGGDPASGTALGNVAFQGNVEPAAVEAGDYQLVLTEASNPANVLFRSQTLTLDAGQSVQFVIVDDTGEGLAPFSVTESGPGGSTVLFDQNTPSGIAVINAATDGEARDVYLDEDYSAPLAAALASPAVSAVVQIPVGDHKLTVTPAGNPGVIEAEESFTAVRGAVETELVSGDPGSLTIAGAQDDRRLLTGQARVRFIDTASLFEGLYIFVGLPGTAISDMSPLLPVVAPEISQRVAFPPGDYELTLFDPTTSTVVAGPTAITFTEGLATVLLANGASGSTADVVRLEGFP
jgi:hypothetical protein